MNKEAIFSQKSTSPDMSTEISLLFDSLDTIHHQPCVTLDDVLNSSNLKSTLGRFYQLFLSLNNKKDYLLNENLSDDFILNQIQSLTTKLNQTDDHARNFIDFMKFIEHIAKENYLSKEYLYEKVSFMKINIFIF